ncbi:MAG: hypothetical protein EA369_07940 [Bradymonadales bacterium]|nr:MAG: hypothetical protein EA369_07940 [Bradymonadales bacterium]
MIGKQSEHDCLLTRQSEFGKSQPYSLKTRTKATKADGPRREDGGDRRLTAYGIEHELWETADGALRASGSADEVKNFWREAGS